MRKWTRAFPSRFVSRAVVARSETNFFGPFLKRPFFIKSLFVWAITLTTRAEPRENKRRFATRAFAMPKSPALLPGARLRVFCHVRVEISHRESRT